MFNAGSIVATLSANIEGFKSGIRQAEKEINAFKSNTAQSLKNVSGNLQSSGQEMQGLGLKLGGLALAGSAGFAGILKAASDVQTLKLSFETMLGSAEEADKLIREMTDFATKTPFSIRGVEESTKKLLAYGFSQETVLEELEMLGNMAAGVGKEKMPNLVLAYGQVRAAGKLTGMELRQFTEAGIPLLEELSKVTGMEVKDMAGNIGELGIPFETVQDALRGMTSEGGRFNDLMSRLAEETLAGKVSNILDSLVKLLRALGAPIIDFATSVAGFVEGILTRVQTFVENVNPKVIQFTALVGAVAVAFTALGAAILVPLGMLLSFAGSLGLFIANIGILMPLITALGSFIAGLILPITAVIAVITALYFAWQSNFAGIREITSTIFSQIASIASTVMSTLFTGIQYVLTVIQEFWKQHGDTIMQIYAMMFAFFAQGLSQMLLITQNILLPMLKFFVIVFGNIVNVIGKTLGFIVSLFTFNYDNIYNAALEMLSAVEIAAKEVMNAAVGAIFEGINRIIGALNELGLAIKDIPGFKTIGRTLANIGAISFTPFDVDSLKKNTSSASSVLGDIQSQVSEMMGDLNAGINLSAGGSSEGSSGGSGGSKAKTEEEKQKAIDWEKEAESNLKELAKKRNSITDNIDDIDSTIADIDEALKDKKHIGNEEELRREREKLLQERAGLQQDIIDIDKKINRADGEYARDLRQQLKEQEKQNEFNDRLGYVDQLIKERNDVSLSTRTDTGKFVKQFDDAKFTGNGVTIQINDSLVADEESARNLLEKAFNAMNLAT